MKKNISIIKIIFILAIVLVIITIPILLLVYFDLINIRKIFNLTDKYDWLSAIFTYLSAIIGAALSAFVLIYITREERKANTELLIALKRPYLDISFQKISPFKIVNHIQNNKLHTIFSKIKIEDRQTEIEKSVHEIVTAVIRNNGESCAMIDLKSIYVKAMFKPNDNSNYEEIVAEIKIGNKVGLLNNEEYFMIFSDEDYYKCGDVLLLEYNIEYYDLTGIKYKCYKNGTNEIIDNEKMK